MASPGNVNARSSDSVARKDPRACRGGSSKTSPGLNAHIEISVSYISGNVSLKKDSGVSALASPLRGGITA